LLRKCDMRPARPLQSVDRPQDAKRLPVRENRRQVGTVAAPRRRGKNERRNSGMATITDDAEEECCESCDLVRFGALPHEGMTFCSLTMLFCFIAPTQGGHPFFRGCRAGRFFRQRWPRKHARLGRGDCVGCNTLLVPISKEGTAEAPHHRMFDLALNFAVTNETDCSFSECSP